ncbi:helix-turn-helix domain-containing protein [Pedobacter chitinilyticus]|uniref:AraC family transcriptional regulator n=1 Tax=Pedobacter chitinilyticus TaxID=2233776 RepID=A0A3S3R682_9SPHI|nr:AraC family transcriptional regulator [Pedobacter chitinilyticus]RWU07510.1 AraC family transcriptional regulator [Pedobacter chitinilyticus]
MPIPKKLLSRKEEITKDFFVLLDAHIEDILVGRTEKMYHIKDFASKLFIHPTHFSNTIKLTTGYSPCHFAEQRVMDEAKKMLSQTHKPINEISFNLTFTDPTNFTKFFKSFEGVTPKQYRRQLIENT